jgi:4-amino-4-deoxy-L-arabinose transferase-like glycosyltransferase
MNAALWPLLGCVACLVPFLNKAYHIDDTLFLYAARQIQDDPVNFYNFAVNWYGTVGDMYEVMQNPPLASYYIAAVASLFGEGEVALHLAFLLPALAAVAGTYCLAQRLCTRPALAALATLLTPAFLVSSTNVMCDTLTLAFWVWAVVFWDQGLRRRQMAFLYLSAVLICGAALSKYIGVSLIPLFLVYTFAFPRGRRGRLTEALVWSQALVVPVLVLAFYQWATATMYHGRGLLFQAVGYSASVRAPWHIFTEALGLEVLTGLCFLGGAVASVLFYLPLLWSRRVLVIGVLVAGGLTLALAPSLTRTPEFRKGLLLGQASNTVPWLAVAQFAAFAVSGFALLALACQDLWARRDAGALLLALWVAGIFVFATFLNWTVNVRSVLPLSPAAGILIARRLDQRFGPAGSVDLRRIAWPLVPAAVLALLVTWADYQMAGTVRAVAADLAAYCRERRRPVWFQGHWGFQYYMEAHRARPDDYGHPAEARPGDLLVRPENNTNLQHLLTLERRGAKTVYERSVRPCGWLATMDISVGAGFYAGVWGSLPFAFGEVKPEHYRVMEFAPRPGAKVMQ